MRRNSLLLLVVPAVLAAVLAHAHGQPGAKTAEKPARVIVRMPANARLYVEENLCPLKSDVRKFSTPPLETGKKYEYTFRVEVDHKEGTVSVSQTKIVKAGETTEVQFGDEQSILAGGGVAPPPVLPVVAGGIGRGMRATGILHEIPAVPPIPPTAAPGVRFPAGPPPWLIAAENGEEGGVKWQLVGDKAGTTLTGELDAGEFEAFTADGTALKNAALKAKLRNKVSVVVSADAKPIDPFYLAVLDSETVVLVPKKPFPGKAELPAPAVLFALAGPGADRNARLRWLTATTATSTQLEERTVRVGQARVIRTLVNEQSMELPFTDVSAYDPDGRQLTATDVALLLKQDTPVILMGGGVKPTRFLLTLLGKDRRVLVVSVALHGP